jgi:hypothetical protein
MEVERAAMAEFLKRNGVRTLNVVGPRESQATDIGKFAGVLLEAVLVGRGGR